MENQTGGRPPKTWLIESILATLFCCLPLGIVGIVNATRVESRFYAGDVAGANQASADAGRWTKIAFFVGIGVNLLIIILYFFVFAAALTGALG